MKDVKPINLIKYNFRRTIRKQVFLLLFLEVILACKYPKKTVSSRLEWKKLGRGISFVYYQQALQGKKLGLNEGRERDPDPLINQREQDMADD